MNPNLQARFRVDGLPIEHAQYATGHTGPISWITSGKVDAVLDIKFPFHPDEQVDFRSIVDQIGRNVGRISVVDHPVAAIPAHIHGQAAEREREEKERDRLEGAGRRRVVLPEREEVVRVEMEERERAREQAEATYAAQAVQDACAASATGDAGEDRRHHSQRQHKVTPS